MSERLLAGLVTAVAVAPNCALCILGPAFFGSILAGALGWFGWLDPVLATGVMIIGALVVFGLARKWNARARHSGSSVSSEPRPAPDPAAELFGGYGSQEESQTPILLSTQFRPQSR